MPSPSRPRDYQREFTVIAEVLDSLNARVEPLDVDRWASFNELRDANVGLSEVMKVIGIDSYATIQLIDNTRRCYLKFGRDPVKLRLCLEGKIDP
jgi:hypothetical protein